MIFTLAFIESHSSAEATHSVFGFFQVPSKLYPWVLLLLLQVRGSAATHLGHTIVIMWIGACVAHSSHRGHGYGRS